MDGGETTEVWVSNVCVKYDGLNSEVFTYTLDNMAEALQRLAIALAVIASVFVIGSCIVPCVPKVSPRIWKGFGFMFILCSILQGCALLFLDSSFCLDNPLIQFLEIHNPGVVATLQNPEKCVMAAGLKLGISAVVFWFVAGVIPCLVPPPSFEEEPVATHPDVEPDVEAKAAQEQPQEQAAE